MVSSTSQAPLKPPSLIKSLMAGFDAISNHIELILFSVVLDLFLWLGPRWQVTGLLEDFIQQATQLPEMQAQTEMLVQFQTLLEDFNWLSLLRTFPVGVPSLLAGQLGMESPLGEAQIWRATSATTAVGLWFIMLGVGIVAGTLYFSAVSQAVFTNQVTWRQILIQWPRASLQMLLLSIMCVVILVMLFIPLSCFMSVFLLSGLGLGQASLFFFLFAAVVVVWLLGPLVFTPHGIFVHHYPTREAIRDSIRLTRWTLPSTTLLLLVIIIISEGLDILWHVPPESSWLLMIGILGHAFVVTSLLATSFVYYRDAQSWVKELLKQTKLTSA